MTLACVVIYIFKIELEIWDVMWVYVACIKPSVGRWEACKKNKYHSANASENVFGHVISFNFILLSVLCGNNAWNLMMANFVTYEKMFFIHCYCLSLIMLWNKCKDKKGQCIFINLICPDFVERSNPVSSVCKQYFFSKSQKARSIVLHFRN